MYGCQQLPETLRHQPLTSSFPHAPAPGNDPRAPWRVCSPSQRPGPCIPSAGPSSRHVSKQATSLHLSGHSLSPPRLHPCRKAGLLPPPRGEDASLPGSPSPWKMTTPSLRKRSLTTSKS